MRADARESSPSFNPEFPSSLVHVSLAARSHQGLVRSSNQDHYLAVRIGRSLETLMTNLAEDLLPRSLDETAYGMLVADGMGGMAAGEVASRTALLTPVPEHACCSAVTRLARLQTVGDSKTGWAGFVVVTIWHR